MAFKWQINSYLSWGRWIWTFIHRSCDSVWGVRHHFTFQLCWERRQSGKSSDACQDRIRESLSSCLSPPLSPSSKTFKESLCTSASLTGVHTDVSKHTSPWRYGAEAKCEFCSKCISSTCRINLPLCFATFSSSEWHFLWLLCVRAAQVFSLGHTQCVITSSLR